MDCKDTRIAVSVRTNKPFNGRIYALGRSETCNLDVEHSDLFRLDLTMSGQDCNTQSVVRFSLGPSGIFAVPTSTLQDASLSKSYCSLICRRVSTPTLWFCSTIRSSWPRLIRFTRLNVLMTCPPKTSHSGWCLLEIQRWSASPAHQRHHHRGSEFLTTGCERLRLLGLVTNLLSELKFQKTVSFYKFPNSSKFSRSDFNCSFLLLAPYGIFARSCVAMAKDSKSTFQIIDDEGLVFE